MLHWFDVYIIHLTLLGYQEYNDVALISTSLSNGVLFQMCVLQTDQSWPEFVSCVTFKVQHIKIVTRAEQCCIGIFLLAQIVLDISPICSGECT